MSTYRELLDAAFARTREWRLTCPGTENFALPSPSPPLGQADVTREQVRAFADDFPDPVADRISDCCGVHHKALMIATATKSTAMPVVTLGDVQVNGKPRYRLTRPHMQQLLRDGRGEARTAAFKFHVWLTFPDMTILDLVLRGALEHYSGRGIGWYRADNYIVVGRNEQLGPELSYEPFLVGEEVLYRIGAIWEKDEETLRRLRAA